MMPERHLPGRLRLPISLCLTCPLAVLAAPLVAASSGSAGQIGLVLLLALAAIAGATGGFRVGLLTGLAAATGLMAGAWFAHGSHSSGLPSLNLTSLPVSQAMVLAGCGAWLGWYVDVVRRRTEQFRERCERFEQSIEQLAKDSQEVAAVAEQERRRCQQLEAQQLELSRLFLSLQHLGRELSGNLDIGEVCRLVTEAARKLLNVAHPRLFLLDEETSELVEHTPGCERGRYRTDRGMLGWVVNHGQMITAEDASNIHSLASMQGQDPAEWQLCAPLVAGQRVVGVLAIESIDQKIPEFERLLYILANFSAVALNNSQLFNRVEHMAHHDGLTGLLNQSALLHRLAEMIDDAEHSRQPLSVIISDLDHFKQFNDRHGHQAGDYVLQSAALLWKKLIPQDAVAGRYGGEEFFFVLPGMGLAEAVRQAEGLRWAQEEQSLEFQGTPLQVTSSFGVAAFPTHAHSAASLIREADAALYAAKRGGRNRVSVAPQAGTEGSVGQKVDSQACAVTSPPTHPDPSASRASRGPTGIRNRRAIVTRRNIDG